MEGREFYKSPAPSSAQWNTTSILTLGYMYFKDKDEAFAKKCFETALRSYNFMTSDLRPSQVYKHPDKYPMGMDPEFFYDQCRKDSTSDLAYQITASADLYRATGEARFLELVKSCVPLVLDKIVDGFVLTRVDNNKKTVSASCSYIYVFAI